MVGWEGGKKDEGEGREGEWESKMYFMTQPAVSNFFKSY